MRVTVSLTDDAAMDPSTDLRKLLEDNSEAGIVRVFGRGRFASMDMDVEQLDQLKAAVGDVCVFAPASKVQPF